MNTVDPIRDRQKIRGIKEKMRAINSEAAFGRCGGKRGDLTTMNGADDFYRSFKHQRYSGYRIYPRI